MGDAAIDDRVVGAAHGGDEIGMRRRQRRTGNSVDNIGERKFQLMRFVQRDFEHAGHHLHAAGEAVRRRIDESQPLGRDAAILRDLSTTSGGGGFSLSSTSVARSA